MSSYNIHLSLPAYLEQWLRHDYWNASSERVEFERGSNCHCIMAAFLKQRPISYKESHYDGQLPVEVPTIKGLRPETHNYLSQEGRSALISAIKRNFKVLLDKELAVFFTQDVSITDIVYAFMEMHGIENTPQNWETIRQMYKRMRDKSVKSKDVK